MSECKDNDIVPDELFIKDTELFEKLWNKYEAQMEAEMNAVAPIPEGSLNCFFNSIHEMIRQKYVHRIQREMGMGEDEMIPFQRLEVMVDGHLKRIDDLELDDYKIIIDRHQEQHIKLEGLSRIELPPGYFDDKDDDWILTEEYCREQRKKVMARHVMEWDPFAHVMFKLRSKRTKLPSFLAKSIHEKAVREYKERFGDITVTINEDYSRDDWTTLLNECLRTGMDIDTYVEENSKDGIPF